MNDKRPPVLFIVSSPSGAGKTTLCRRLLGEFRDLRFSVSHTTREPRRGEIDGKDYYFVDAAEFNRMVEEDMFIEWARVHGNMYGTSRAEIDRALDAGADVIFDVDYQGARQIKEKAASAVAVFVLPPSIEELHRRLKGRGTESAESLKRRFNAAIEEIGHHHLFDYLIVNDDLNVAYDTLRAILIAERSRELRMADLAFKMLV